MKTNKSILSKLKSVELCLSAHPDNTEGSEFEDRISDLKEIQKELKGLSEDLIRARWDHIFHRAITLVYIFLLSSCAFLIYYSVIKMTP